MVDRPTVHPSDTDLLDLLTHDAEAWVGRHVDTCDRCRSRLARWRALSDEVASGLAILADEGWSEAALQHQRAAVLRRLRGRGQLLRFPTASSMSPAHRAPGRTPIRRWVAAAAIGGLLVGTLTGRLFMASDVVRPLPRAGQAGMEASPPLPALQPTLVSAAAVPDEVFLVELDAALLSRGPTTLRALDALTPDDHEPGVPRP